MHNFHSCYNSKYENVIYEDNSSEETQDDCKSAKEQQDYFPSPKWLKNWSGVSKGNWVKFSKIKSEGTQRWLTLRYNLAPLVNWGRIFFAEMK